MTKQQQFGALMEQHRGILHKVCRSYCRQQDDREDLAQEIAVQLWRAFPGFDERYKFSTWMYRIALNVAISFYRRESRHARYLLSSEEHLLEAVDIRQGQSDEMESIYHAIGQLEPLNRALVLLYLDGNSYQEIAGVLGISETNVATRLGRLKQSMREEITGEKREERK